MTFHASFSFRPSLRLFFSLSLLVLIATPAQAAKKGTADQIATIKGQTVTREDINTAEIAKTRKKLYDLEQAELMRVAINRLRKLHPKTFPEGDFKITSDEIQTIYDKAGLSKRGPLVAFEDQIRDYLIATKERNHQTILFAKAVKMGYVKSLLSEPPAFDFRLPFVSRKASQGPENAPVHIVEFSDFQCPFCTKVIPTLNALMKKYPGKIHLVYRHLPLDSIHKEARAAAVASECAADQDRFWPYHDLVFANNKALTDDNLKKFGKQVKVSDQKKFEACIKSNHYNQRVNGDIAAAHSMDITGTPGFLVGRRDRDGMIRGEVISGALPLAVFTKTVDKYLKK